MDTEERKTTLYRGWDQLSMDEMLPFHKLLTGGFRNGCIQRKFMQGFGPGGKGGAGGDCSKIVREIGLVMI